MSQVVGRSDDDIVIEAVLDNARLFPEDCLFVTLEQQGHKYVPTFLDMHSQEHSAVAFYWFVCLTFCPDQQGHCHSGPCHNAEFCCLDVKIEGSSTANSSDRAVAAGYMQQRPCWHL